jgi:replicative DNA helicase
VFEIAERGSRGRSGFVAVRDILPQTIDRLDTLHQNPGEIRGVPTGFTLLDKKTAGLQAGDLVVIAGRPSMGKSTLAVNIAESAAIAKGVPAAIFTMEMSAEQMTLRMISSLGRVSATHLRTGNFTDEDWSRIQGAMAQLSGAPIYLDESPALTPTELRARARRLKRERGLGLVIVDYLQLMQVPGTKENRATEISEISRGLKALAKELQVPVIAISQLNRAVEQRTDKKPVMSDLRESGAIEQDADLILLIYREEVYDQNTTRRGVADIIIAKQRNGPIGEVQLTFLGEYTRFENLVAESYGEGAF